MLVKTFMRQSYFGRIVYHLSKHRYFSYKEEQPDYVVPERYLVGTEKASTELDSIESEKKNENDMTVNSDGSSDNARYIFVDWDGEDDPENPKNWPFHLKFFFIMEVALLTLSVYMGAAIYTPGIEEIMEKFQIGTAVAALPLSLFVFGYGIGPMIFSPMSESPTFGRTSIYIVTLFFFAILQIPTALADNIAGLCVLRFLSGFFASPCLATGGASVGDILTLPYFPIGLAMWGVAAVCGPSIGPLIGAAVTQGGGWRWPFWFLLIISSFSTVFLFFLLPESYDKAILYRKASRLRAITGNQNIVSEAELEQRRMTKREMAIDILWRPIEITLMEPVVFLINIYIALIYSIMYLWFEAFPIVFSETYNFTLVESGVTYVSVMIGILFGAVIYIPIIWKHFTTPLKKNENVYPEVFIPPAIIGSLLMPAGIFIFGWSASKNTFWIGPLIGAGIFASGAFIIFQTLFNYLGMSFVRYMASVFASNDLMRSVIAGVFPIFGRSLFLNLKTSKYPVAWGSTILGCISVLMIAIPVLFYLSGPKLRARSKYAGF
ncbi:Piso0_001290 [Millerozyma farinosa CBS 7064]|uniref:Piso0_001290 protein n=1 Tax=Pichia sorbitophila (strain ATCC MYA-4447 / BCRC 22081 / CBS 7064 / NBRC 10061 / NRRL Y-12695) TaxID=559304 RepID=G8YDZ1_PICSO|nr:Piso0_001290 [Millerozyma farinosa CBS 7064]